MSSAQRTETIHDLHHDIHKLRSQTPVTFPWNSFQTDGERIDLEHLKLRRREVLLSQ
jgi:hypothetical protein